MPTEGVPRIRQAGIPREAVLVVRGDDIEAVITADARRFRRRFAAWGRYGVSSFVAGNDAEVAALCESRLVAWARVLVFRRSALEDSGVDRSDLSDPARHHRPHRTARAGAEAPGM